MFFHKSSGIIIFTTFLGCGENCVIHEDCKSSSHGQFRKIISNKYSSFKWNYKHLRRNPISIWKNCKYFRKVSRTTKSTCALLEFHLSKFQANYSNCLKFLVLKIIHLIYYGEGEFWGWTCKNLDFKNKFIVYTVTTYFCSLF